jgi:ubiquinone/menaquinone biosynthesis C-methylase UbiE
MTDNAQIQAFTDAESYEKFMGQWSRVAGRLFLDWLSLPKNLKWLDVGCGTGAFTETIQQTCAPAEIVAIDPAPAQIAYAQSRNTAAGAKFQVVDARSMPFEDDRFDFAVSALLLNFIPDREKAVAEMRRVVRPGGIVAAYVWDFAGRSGTAQHLNSAVAEIEGSGYRPPGLNAESTSLSYLKALFESAGLTDVETRPIEISVTFQDFDDYWNSNTTFASPIGTYVKGLPGEKRQRLMQSVKSRLPIDAQGAIAYTARVNAVRGRA